MIAVKEFTVVNVAISVVDIAKTTVQGGAVSAVIGAFVDTVAPINITHNSESIKTYFQQISATFLQSTAASSLEMAYDKISTIVKRLNKKYQSAEIVLFDDIQRETVMQR